MLKLRRKSQSTGEIFTVIYYLNALWELLTIAIALPGLLILFIMFRHHLPSWMLIAGIWGWLPFILIAIAIGIPFGRYRANLYFGNLDQFSSRTHRIKLFLSAWSGDLALAPGTIGAVLFMYALLEKSNLVLRLSASIVVLLLFNNITFWTSYVASYYHRKR